ncbi:hypothetical protein [Chryseobacterium arthrosphaerae]|uniref:hypothetical protein n=1 Tax=Chryseobacterium arthrosphaerae TaxID=651561 RepID=UPI003D34C41B
MKRFNFNQTGGLKLVTETLAGIQDAYTIYSGALKMAGDKAILSGCEELGGTVTNGFVLIGDEILEFKGAVKQDTVIIKEEIINSQFEDGSLKPFETYRYVTFGYSANALTWSSFRRVPALIELPSQLAALNNKIDNLTNAIGFVRKGEIYIGDVSGKSVGWLYNGVDYKIQLINAAPGGTNGGDDLYLVTFNSPLDISTYKIFTSIKYSGSYGANNDVIFSISNINSTGFQLSVREVSPDVQNISFDYIIFKN